VGWIVAKAYGLTTMNQILTVLKGDSCITTA